MPKVIQNKLRFKHKIFFTSALILPLILVLSNSSVSVATSNVDYNISIASSLNLEITSNTVSMILNPASKTFDTKDLGITVGTNYINGYNLYINSDSTSLTNSEYTGTSYTIGTLTGPTTTEDFPAGYWGYRISSGDTGDDGITDTSTQSDSTNYYKFVPNTLVSSSPTAINNNATTLTFATKIDYTKPAGTYTNTFTFNAIVNPVTYSIAYADNTGDTIGSMPSPNPQTGMIASGSATLSSAVPTRDGYTFKSWCLGTVSNSGTTCTGTEYSAGGSFPISSTVGPEVAATLTAVWIENKLYMQDVIANICTADYQTVYDNRDEQEYVIQRLADGKCWMTSNLNLAGGTKLDSDGSNVPSGYTQSNPYYTLPTSSTDGFSDDTTAYVYNSGRTDCSGAGCYSYYSWLAATAGSGSSVSSNGYNASYSICPKGWRLPTATTSDAAPQTSPNWKTGDLYALATAYGANLESNFYDSSSTTGGNFYTNAGPGTTPNFLLAGSYNSSSPVNVGSRGRYWSSTSSSSTSAAYSLSFFSSLVYSVDHNSRRYGYSVRCILAE